MPGPTRRWGGGEPVGRAPRHVRQRGRKGLAIGLILGLMTVLVAARPVEAEPALKVPTLHWVECGAPFQCATAVVPLDYDEPNGPTITLALTRRPADDPGRRIGSMFINPGGPGGPGTGVVRAAEFLWTPEVLARFDIIGFDPRGVGAVDAAAVLPLERGPRPVPGGHAVLPVPGRPGRPRTWTRSGATASSACATAGRSSGTCRPPTSPGTWTCCGRRSATTGSPTTGCRTARSSATSTPTSSRTRCGRS